MKLKWQDWPEQQTCKPPLKSDESGGFSTVEPWSMSWGWACLCGPSWPSFVTQWLVSSSWSSSSSSTRPARCLPTKRRCQCSRRRSRRRPSTSTCWPQPDNDWGLKDNFRLQSICVQCWAFPSWKFFCFLVCSHFSVEWILEQANRVKTCGKTKNNKRGPILLSLLCVAGTVHLSACLLCSPQADHDPLLYSILRHPHRWDERDAV